MIRLLTFIMSFPNLYAAAEIPCTHLDTAIFFVKRGHHHDHKLVKIPDISTRLDAVAKDHDHYDALQYLMARKGVATDDLLSLKPDTVTSPILLCALGVAFERGAGCVKDLKMAEKCYRRALSFMPQFQLAVYRLAMTLRKSEELNSALTYFDLLLKTPFRRKAYYKMALIYERQNRQGAAENCFSYLANEALPETKYNQVACFKMGQRWENAEVLDKALHYYDKSAEYHAECAYRAAILTVQDQVRAAHYHKLAADLGKTESQKEIARRLEHGIGIQKDAHLAANYRQRAADQAYREGQLYSWCNIL